MSLLLAAILAAPACLAPGEMPGTHTVLELNGEKISLARLDAEVAEALCAARVAHAQKLEEIRRAALKEFIDKRLLEAEMKRTKIADMQSMVAKAAEGVKPPSEADVKAFYEANKARIDGDYDAVKEEIREYLIENGVEGALRSFIEGLRAKASVKRYLPRYRVKVAAEGPAKGPEKAPITIVEFADFECGFCARAGETVAEVMKKYPGKIRLVFRDYPLGFHQNAIPAAVAARCAGDQGKYWPMHDKLFASEALDVASLKKAAREVGVDAGKFDACLDGNKHAAAVKADMAAGDQAGVNGTPAFFINGVPLSGAQPMEAFTQIIDEELAK